MNGAAAAPAGISAGIPDEAPLVTAYDQLTAVREMVGEAAAAILSMCESEDYHLVRADAVGSLDALIRLDARLDRQFYRFCNLGIWSRN